MWMDDDSDYYYSDEESPFSRRRFESLLRRVKDNNPGIVEIHSRHWNRECIQNMTDNDWEDFGRDITNNTHLERLLLHGDGFVAGEQTISSLFRGLTGSNSIKGINLTSNNFGVEGVRSMVPLLQNANNLKFLEVVRNNIGSQGFALLMRALSDSPIEILHFDNCGIESIEIVDEHSQKN